MNSKTANIMTILNNKKTQKALLLALLAALAIIFYLNFLLKPQLIMVMNAVVSRNKAGRDLKNAEEKIAKVTGYKIELASYEEKVKKYEKILPAEQEIPGLLENLSNMARSSGVKIVEITPAMPKDGAFQKGDIYQEMPILITARSGYHELGCFLSSLECSDRFMKVVDIAIRSDKASPKKHNVELLVITYILLSN